MQFDMFGMPITNNAPMQDSQYGMPVQDMMMQNQGVPYQGQPMYNNGMPNQGQPMYNNGMPYQGQPMYNNGMPNQMGVFEGAPQGVNTSNHTYQTMLQYDKYNQPVVKKRDVTEMLKDYIFQNTGVYVSNIIKIEDEPDTLRHCCIQSGISNLPKNNFFVYGTDISTTFYFCKTCGNLYLPAYTFY